MIVQFPREPLEGAGGTQNRGKRCLKVMRDGGKKGRAKALRLLSSLRLVEIVDEVHPLYRQCRLIDESIQKPALVWCEERPELVAVEADDANRAAACAHRQKESLGARQSVGAASCRAIMFPCPFCRGDVGIVD